MVPVMQTKFSDEVGGVHGNCMAACVASIMELDIEDIPAWEDMGNDGSWGESYYSFLESHGYETDGMANREGYTESALWDFVLDQCPGVDGYFIVGGDSPRIARGHAVIYCNREMIHDPHPSGMGVSVVREVYLIQRKIT